MNTLKFYDFAEKIQFKATVFSGTHTGLYTVGLQTDGFVRLIPVTTAIKVALIRASKLTQDEYINCTHGEFEWHKLVTDVVIMSDHWQSWEELVDECVFYAFGDEPVQIERVKPNRAKCLTCSEVIESKHRHDFVRCGCGNIFIDGGLDYFRAGWRDDLASFKVLDWPEFDNMTSDAQV